MRDDDVGAIPVARNGRLIGIVTDRDLACRCLPDTQEPWALMALDVMTKGVHVCSSEDGVEEALDLMEARGVRRLPVVNSENRLVGLLERDGVMASHIAHRGQDAGSLERARPSQRSAGKVPH